LFRAQYLFLLFLNARRPLSDGCDLCGLKDQFQKPVRVQNGARMQAAVQEGLVPLPDVLIAEAAKLDGAEMRNDLIFGQDAIAL
jgi:hypothetical protein